ncbi:hypothetical protein L6452_38619 [Arctium lappa]|uniref:Uncharacterized protein n=1 Tax=Arctium lappa TaxID=4217 RepID=A0ACB8XQX4_ARCLA|nr:hypothetical protein L6452_38619 [Arctium lappa]
MNEGVRRQRVAPSEVRGGEGIAPSFVEGRRSSVVTAYPGKPEGNGSTPPFPTVRVPSSEGDGTQPVVHGSPMQQTQSARIPVFERLSVPTMQKEVELGNDNDKKLAVVALPKELTQEADIASKGQNKGNKKIVDADGFTTVTNKKWRSKPKADDRVKGGEAGTSGSKEGANSIQTCSMEETQPQTVEIEPRRMRLTLSMREKQRGGGGPMPIIEETSIMVNHLQETTQGPCNQSDEQRVTMQGDSAMQVKATKGGAIAVERGAKNTMESGKSVVDGSVKKPIHLGITISPTTRDQFNTKGAGSKGVPGTKPIKGILKNPKRFTPLAEHGEKGAGSESVSKTSPSC